MHPSRRQTDGLNNVKPDAVMSDSARGAEHPHHSRGASPPFHVTLTIGQEDAVKMMKASEDYNDALNRLRRQRIAESVRKGSSVKEGSLFKKEVDGQSSSKLDKIGTDAVGQEAIMGNIEKEMIIELLLDAAEHCSNPLVKSFYNVLREGNKSVRERQACLILLLDMDKSNKLLTAFQVLEDVTESSKTLYLARDTSTKAREVETSPVKTGRTVNVKLEESSPVCTEHETNSSSSEDFNDARNGRDSRLSSNAVKMLFQCFLTAISMCIRDQGRNSATPKKPRIPGVTPTSDSLHRKSPLKSSETSDEESCYLSPSKEIEIRDISAYAADQFVKHVEKRRSNENNDEIYVTFEDFGEWYNDGGFALVPWLELLSLAKWDFAGKVGSTTGTPSRSETPTERVPQSVSHSPEPRKCVVSFDFSGAMPHDKPLHIDITESNLVMLKAVVTRTGLLRRSPQEMCEVILRHASHSSGARPVSHRPGMPPPTLMLSKDDFGRCMRELIPPSANLVHEEIVNFSNFLVSLFSCFDRQDRSSVNAKEIAAGFSFLCGGNKSSKLAIAFQLLDEHEEGRLSSHNLSRFLRSYLAVIVGISVHNSKLSRLDMFNAVDNGANWTQSHVMSSSHVKRKNYVTFEEFAEWYTEGGYTVAPWLELLDLNKFISLLDTGSPLPSYTPPIEATPTFLSHDTPGRGIHPGSAQAPSTATKEVLFTFPLANKNELVVLKEDVSYVRKVVDELGLSMVRPEDVWASLCKQVSSSYNWNTAKYEVDQKTFVDAVVSCAYNLTGRTLDGESKYTLSNFFSSYDLEQSHCVELNYLMGGLTLLCLGRKSAKLAFSFGLFDGRGNNSSQLDSSKKNETGAALNGDELFVFLRSFLIVLFSCCAQSLNLTADGVTQWINDTSKMVCGEVMRFQWNSGKRCVNFDDFGVWYNEGGYEIAPWLELLDLNKWVLEGSTILQVQISANNSNVPPQTAPSRFPDPQSDPSPHHDIHHPMPMDSDMAEDFPYDTFPSDFDNILANAASDEKENANSNTHINPHLNPTEGEDDSSLTFQLLTNDEHQGFSVSISQDRVSMLRHLLTESGFYRLDTSQLCGRLIDYSDKATGALSKDQYDSSMRSIVAESGINMSRSTQQNLSDVLTSLFYAFDREKRSKVDAIEFACGITVLCGGRKSDKLEFAYELMDDDKDGKLSRQGLWRYLRAFLTVLVTLSSSRNVMKEERTLSAVDSGASWACSQAFGSDSNVRLICFDEFAAWYTNGGYSIIPWLELLDLRKWVIVS